MKNPFRRNRRRREAPRSDFMTTSRISPVDAEPAGEWSTVGRVITPESDPSFHAMLTSVMDQGDMVMGHVTEDGEYVIDKRIDLERDQS